MTITKIILLVLVFLILLTAIVLITISIMKQSKKDWKTVEDLERKMYTIRTKEELNMFYDEFIDKASKIDNTLIQVRLNYINGYLRGLNKTFIE